MKKIVILMLHLGYGGVEKQTISMANRLCDKYEVTIISFYKLSDTPAYDVNDKIKIKYLLKKGPNRNEIKDCIQNHQVFKLIKEVLKAIKILYQKKKLMKKEVISLKCDYVFSTRTEYAGLLSKYCPKNIVKITQEHNYDTSKKYMTNVKNKIKNIDYLIVMSNSQKELYKKWLTSNIKIVVIPNMISSVSTKISKCNSKSIIAVGRLHPVKNFTSLIEAMKEINKIDKEVVLHILGDGEEKTKLKSLVENYKLDDVVVFHGMVTEDEVNKRLEDASLLVMTSEHECFPMVLIEAENKGVPLISYDIPAGPQCIIKNGYNGFLIEKNNPKKLANKIIKVLNDQEMLKSLSKNAKLDSKKYYPESVMRLWYKLFK